jgi:thioredoxin-dependent peroxiredoxin
MSFLLASVSDAEAKEKYPDGWKTVKPYLRLVPQPGANLYGSD